MAIFTKNDNNNEAPAAPKIDPEGTSHLHLPSAKHIDNLRLLSEGDFTAPVEVDNSASGE